MTERIDLDDLDVATDDERTPTRGDWFWRGDGDPRDEYPEDAPSTATPAESDAAPADTDAAEVDPTEVRAVPRVPRERENWPVGIPIEGGGAGGAGGGWDTNGSGGIAGDATAGDAAPDDAGASRTPAGDAADEPATLTMAMTYEAIRRLDDPAGVIADARGWADWIGVVGDVPAHALNAFQRRHGVDVDFFNGAGTAPAERLAAIDSSSMFDAERLVVVGVDGEEGLARRTGWEFVPLSIAAAKAGWTIDGSEASDGG
ncbi:DUF7124 domain-containing protein [Halegenticoccus tardaugens]|uniref:DUF7124 domain-containing protein n=1 Tax=Halegenticoccus tardaugens TaxID=2071624 RepID=UPI00100B32BB|nr:hypothetical protein [Halegenticoccus tardaugens]